MGVFIQPPFWATPSQPAPPFRWRSVVITPPTMEPLTVADVKSRGRIETDAEDTLISSYIKAARDQVERDTGLALQTQTRQVFFDTFPADRAIAVPWPPLQSVTWVKYVTSAGVLTTWNVSNYVVDVPRGKLALAATGVMPTDLRGWQPWSMEIVVGWTTPALMPPLLVEAVGMLAVHFLTLGRDLVTVGIAGQVMPQAYEEKIALYREVSLA